jgi:hypothetical protein
VMRDYIVPIWSGQATNRFFGQYSVFFHQYTPYTNKPFIGQSHLSNESTAWSLNLGVLPP